MKHFIAAGFVAIAGVGLVVAQGGKPTPPQTKTVDQTDMFHGVEVADPYRWLEDDVRQSDEVRQWVEAQNEVTFGYLESIEQREPIRKRLVELIDYERVSAPSRVGDRYVVSRNDGLQQHSVIYLLDSLDGEGRVLFDPNGWSEDGTTALGGLDFSEDGSVAAYGIQESGSDWRTWKFRDVESGEDVEDELRGLRFGGPVWKKDGSGVFYIRWDEPETGAFVEKAGAPKLYYHEMGTDQREDVLVFERPDNPQLFISPGVGDDGRYLFVSIGQPSDRNNELYYIDLENPLGMPRPIVTGFDAQYSIVANRGSELLVQTDNDAPMERVVRFDLHEPERENWVDVIPEGDDILRGVNHVGNMLAANYLADASTRIRLYRLDGSLVREVELPGIGSAGGFGGDADDTETFFTFTSFDRPAESYRYDLLTGERELLARPEVDFDPERFVVKQEFFESKDGTRVPMFIVHRKGISMDGSNPTLLYGYGGFNIPITPSFSTSRVAWMEMGGVLAVANIRGGGEYGKEWHEAAIKTNRQKAYEDFIAAAETLIGLGYTTSERLAIQGGSNGGLLVGAVMTQRPDLIGAALPAVGVMDMLRYHLFTIGWAWESDYGSVEKEDEFAALYRISPYHKLLRDGPRAYPPTLVTTADTDDRVVPGHSFKFAAALQANQTADVPTLIRIETSAGHGSGKPLMKRVEETADVYAFLADVFEIGVPESWRNSSDR